MIPDHEPRGAGSGQSTHSLSPSEKIAHSGIAPREAKIGGGVWHEYILLFKKYKKRRATGAQTE